MTACQSSETAFKPLVCSRRNDRLLLLWLCVQFTIGFAPSASTQSPRSRSPRLDSWPRSSIGSIPSKMAPPSENILLEESAPFLAETADGVYPGGDTQSLDSNSNTEPKSDARIKQWLYASHFLSTWNSRLFEFGAVLFLAKLFPSTLLPSSVYALLRAASAICFSPSLGSYIDRAERLKTVRISIVGQRVAVILSCLLFWFIMSIERFNHPALKPALLGIVCLLACVEKLCSVMNLVAVERDWVVVISENTDCELGVLNAQMRRIDLFCKLVGPLTIALVDGFSTRVAIWTVMSLSSAFVLAEYCAIAKASPASRAFRCGL